MRPVNLKGGSSTINSLPKEINPLPNCIVQPAADAGRLYCSIMAPMCGELAGGRSSQNWYRKGQMRIRSQQSSYSVKPPPGAQGALC